MQALLIKWAVIGLLVAAFGAWAWFKGNEHGTQKLIDYQAEQAAAAVAIITKQGTVTTRWLTRYVQVAGASTAAAEEVKKEVTTYANAGACLNPDWFRLHDRAALGALPQPGTGPVGGVSQAAASTGWHATDR